MSTTRVPNLSKTSSWFSSFYFPLVALLFGSARFKSLFVRRRVLSEQASMAFEKSLSTERWNPMSMGSATASFVELRIADFVDSLYSSNDSCVIELILELPACEDMVTGIYSRWTISRSLTFLIGAGTPQITENIYCCVDSLCLSALAQRL